MTQRTDRTEMGTGRISPNGYYTVFEAADLLQVSRSTVCRWIKTGKLPAPRVGPKAIRICEEDLTTVLAPVPGNQCSALEGASAPEHVDFRRVFEATPGLFLILKPDAPRFTIVAVSDAYAAAAMTKREEILGKGLFEVFPDNPDDQQATGVRNLSASLLQVLRDKKPHEMAIQKYDIRRPQQEGGTFELRYWRPFNNPVLDSSGQVAYIIHSVVDVTGTVLAEEKERIAEARAAKQEERAVQQAATTQQLEQAHALLQESEARLRAFVSASSDVIYRMSPDWTVMHQLDGRSFLADTGKPDPDWLQKYIHPRDQERVLAAINEAIRTKSVFQLEHQVKQADGTLGWTFSRAIPVLDQHGEIVEWFGTASDITERKRAEEAVRIARDEADRRRRLYEAVTGSTPDLIYVFDLSYRFTYANDALLKMWGRTWEEAIGKGLLELGYEPWHARMHEREIDQVVATKQSIRGVVAFPHATLGRRIYDYIFTPVLNAEGDVEAVAGTTRDITELEQAQDAFKASEARFRALADNIPILCWMANADGWINWYNRRWYEYTGTTPQEMEGWGWQAVHDPAVLPTMLEHWNRSLPSGSPFEMTFPLKGRDGVFRPFLTRAVPIRDDSGTIVQWFGINTDITKQVELERQKEAFLGIASHELRTPLTTIKAYTQLLDRQGHSPKQTSRLLEQVVRMERLIMELLDTSRLQQGRLELHPEPMELGQLAHEVVERCAEDPACSDRHHLEVEASEPVVGVWDRLRLDQVLSNLVVNAIKYSPSGGEVRLAVFQRERQAIVTVSDQGMGMDQDEQARLFAPFQRGKGAYTVANGMGLGLYIAAEIVKQHGGSITVASELGKGTTFTVSLPRTSRQDTERCQPAQ